MYHFIFIACVLAVIASIPNPIEFLKALFALGYFILCGIFFFVGQWFFGACMVSVFILVAHLTANHQKNLALKEEKIRHLAFMKQFRKTGGMVDYYGNRLE